MFESDVKTGFAEQIGAAVRCDAVPSDHYVHNWRANLGRSRLKLGQ